MPIRGYKNRESKALEIAQAPLKETVSGSFAVDHPEGREALVEPINGSWKAVYGGRVLGVFSSPEEAFQEARSAKVWDVLGVEAPGDRPPVAMPSPLNRLVNRFGGLPPEEVKRLGGYTNEEADQVLFTIQDELTKRKARGES